MTSSLKMNNINFGVFPDMANISKVSIFRFPWTQRYRFYSCLLELASYFSRVYFIIGHSECALEKQKTKTKTKQTHTHTRVYLAKNRQNLKQPHTCGHCQSIGLPTNKKRMRTIQAQLVSHREGSFKCVCYKYLQRNIMLARSGFGGGLSTTQMS